MASEVSESMPPQNAASAGEADDDRLAPCCDSEHAILHASFGVVRGIGGSRARLLLLGTAHGWRAWDLDGDAGGVVRCVAASHELRPTSATCLLLAEEGEEGDHKGPQIVVGGPERDGDASIVRCFSLADGGGYTPRTLHFDTPVLALRANARCVVVGLDGRASGFDPRSGAPLFSLFTAAAPPGGGLPLALVGDWLAHASADPPAAGGGGCAATLLATSPPDSGPSWQTLAKAGVKTAAAGLSSAGRLVGRAMSSRGAEAPPSPPPSPPPSYAEATAAGGGGAAMLVTVPSGRPLAHFQAHPQPLSLLQFGGPASARLLLSASAGGGMAVHAVRPGGVQQLYRLHKGLSSRSTAVAAHISACGCWAAACTSRGTTHLFGLDPRGGAVCSPRRADAPGQSGPPPAPLTESLRPVARVRAGEAAGWLGAGLEGAARVAQALQGAGMGLRGGGGGGGGGGGEARAAAAVQLRSLADCETGGGGQTELLLLGGGWLTRFVLLPPLPPPASATGAAAPPPPPPPPLVSVQLQALARWDFRAAPWPVAAPGGADCLGGSPPPPAASEAGEEAEAEAEGGGAGQAEGDATLAGLHFDA